MYTTPMRELIDWLRYKYLLWEDERYLKIAEILEALDEEPD